VLEDRLFERVCGSHSIPMTARVVAATCHDLADLVREGRFRPDLYFRLNVITIEVPPLRARLDDLPVLVAAGIRRFAESFGIAPPEVHDSFYGRLVEHGWPGNIRELLNLIERLLARVYADVPERLHPVAQRSLTAHLLKLRADGRASESAKGWALEARGG